MKISNKIPFLTLFIILIISVNLSKISAQTVFFPELSLNGLYAMPIGKMSEADVAPSKNGFCASGGQLGLKLSHRFYRKPYLSFSIKTGFLMLSSKTQKTMKNGTKETVDLSPWIGSYLMPGIQFEKGKRFKIGIGLSAGLLFNKSWNGTRISETDVPEVEYIVSSYKSKLGVGVGISPELSLIFQITKKVHFFCSGEYYLGSGNRLTSVEESRTIWGLESKSNYTVTSKASINYFAVGIGMRYKFHRY